MVAEWELNPRWPAYEASPGEHRLPIQHDRDGRAGFYDGYEEPPAVSRDVVSAVVARPQGRRKEPLWNAGAGAIRPVECRRHHPAVEREEEEFLAIATPSRRHASIARDGDEPLTH